MKSQVIQGNNADVLRTFPDNHFDSIVTDPPYGIDFLGKSWDANTGALETYQECLRVLKPGGHILAFSAARTYHHLAVTLEQAGFEIRDQIMWIYSSGFPKSQDIGKSIDRAAGKKHDYVDYHNDQDDTRNVSNNANAKNRHCKQCGKQLGTSNLKCDENPCVIKNPPYQTKEAKAWAGWGTQLKPAHEPIVMARKPIKLSIAKNCQAWGVGALHIDATRVPFADENDQPSGGENGWSRVGFSEAPVEKYSDQKKKKSDVEIYLNNKRGPMERALIADGDNIGMFDGGVGYKAIKRKVDPAVDLPSGRFPSNVVGEIAEPYQKYFYCPKVSRGERHVGFDDDTTMNKHEWLMLVGGKWVDDQGNMSDEPQADSKMCWIPDKGKIYVHGLRHEVEEILKAQGRETEIPEVKGNNHPTVKPIELMKYLIKLVTPAGGRVLDPFNGSGSTGCAAVELDMQYTGIELDPAYVAIAERRIEAWQSQCKSGTTFEALFE